MEGRSEEGGEESREFFGNGPLTTDQGHTPSGGVESSKDLSQAGFEDVMAVLEDSGFSDSRQGGTYWRDKVRDRGQAGNARMVHLIRELAEKSVYPLDRLAWRQSGGRTEDVEQLTPREAWMLIEMLKGSNKRSEERDAKAKHVQPSLF
jgi:hypothetical protein